MNSYQKKEQINKCKHYMKVNAGLCFFCLLAIFVYALNGNLFDYVMMCWYGFLGAYTQTSFFRRKTELKELRSN